MNQSLLKQCVAELIGTFALIFIGVGAMNQSPGLLGVAFAHGLTIAVMVSATAGISGGPLNPGLTSGLPAGSPPAISAVGETMTDRTSTRLNSSHRRISYAVSCVKIH